MTRNKSVIVTFRVDQHLAEALDRLPDKSSFIRDALRRSFHETCPACGGEGRVDCDAAAWLRGVLDREGAQNCDCCSTTFPPPAAGTDAATQSVICGHCGPDGHRH